MNSIIEEIHRELDALIEVIKAFEKYEYVTPRIMEPETRSLSSASTEDMSSSSQQQEEGMKNGSPAVEKRRQESSPRPGDPDADGPSISLLSPKAALTGTLNEELLSMFNASSISPASGRLRLPKKELRVKIGQGFMVNKVRYVKVHLIGSYTTAEQMYRGKVTFMTYTVDNRNRSEDRAWDNQQSDEEADGEETPDFKPKVTHTKGKVHILYDDLKSPKLEQVKESLADYGLRIKCRLEQKYNFNLYDWRSDTPSIDLSDPRQAELLAYEKILMYKKTLNPGQDETDSWESDVNFLSDLIN